MPDQRDDGPRKGESRPAPSWHRYAVPALLLVHAAACWLARPIGYLTGQDDLEYVALGQSLRDLGYTFLFRVDQPIHAQYPPGYPAMLAIWGAIGGDGFDWLALLSLLLSVATLLVAYLAARRVFGDRIAIASLAVLTVNPGLIATGGNVASEAPFTLLSMVSLLLLLSEDRRAKYAGWAGAVAILAALTRSVGITLVVAIGLHWLIERRWKRVGLFGGAALLLVGGWMLWTIVSPERHVGSSYVADLQAAVARATGGASFLTRAWNRFTFYASQGGPHTLAVPTIPGTPLDNVVTTLVLVSALAAGTWLLLRRWRPAGLLLLAYGSLLLTWTWRTDRFLVPLVPIVVPALLAGIALPLTRRWPRAAAGAVVVAAVLLMVGGAARTGEAIADRSGCRDWDDLPPANCVTPDQASFFAAVRHIRDRVPADAVFVVAKPGALWHYAGHQSISYPAALAQGPDDWVPYLREQGASWILLSDLEQGEPYRYSRWIEENCDSLALERRFPERTYLFRLVDHDAVEDRREGAGEACEAVRRYRNDTAERATGP